MVICNQLRHLETRRAFIRTVSERISGVTNLWTTSCPSIHLHEIPPYPKIYHAESFSIAWYAKVLEDICPFQPNDNVSQNIGRYLHLSKSPSISTVLSHLVLLLPSRTDSSRVIIFFHRNIFFRIPCFVAGILYATVKPVPGTSINNERLLFFFHNFPTHFLLLTSKKTIDWPSYFTGLNCLWHGLIMEPYFQNKLVHFCKFLNRIYGSMSFMQVS